MIDAIPLDPVHLDFQFREGERVVAEMKSSRWRARAEVVISAEHYQLYHEGFFRGDFVVAQDRRVLARASTTSTRGDDFSLELGAGRLTLQRGPAAERRFGVFDGEREVGRIVRDGPDTRRTRLELPERWPLAEQIFLFWLTLIVWTRDEAAALT